MPHFKHVREFHRGLMGIISYNQIHAMKLIFVWRRKLLKSSHSFKFKFIKFHISWSSICKNTNYFNNSFKRTNQSLTTRQNFEKISRRVNCIHHLPRGCITAAPLEAIEYKLSNLRENKNFFWRLQSIVLRRLQCAWESYKKELKCQTRSTGEKKSLKEMHIRSEERVQE